MNGKDRMTVPGKRTVKNVRIHSVTAKSIGCITSSDTKYKLHKVDDKYPHFNEKDFSDDFRDLESQGHGKTYIRVPADPEYDNVSHLYNRGTIKSKYENNQPFGLQGETKEPIEYSEVTLQQDSGQAPTNNESFILPSEPQVAVSHNGDSSTTNNESKDNEIPIAQTYDLNGNPI